MNENRRNIRLFRILGVLAIVLLGGFVVIRLQDGWVADVIAWVHNNKVHIEVLALAALYAAMVVTIRWQMIACPVHSQQRARLDAIQVDLSEATQLDNGGLAGVQGLLHEARGLVHHHTLFDKVFWSRGRETAAWQLIDEAEQRLVPLWPSERLLARLPAMAAQLSDLGTRPALVVAGEIHKQMKLHPDQPTNERLLRELCVEAMSLQRGMLRSEDLAIDYHNNKLMWYILISLIAIALVSNFLPILVFRDRTIATVDQSATLAYLTCGAIGGVLSRITRAIRSDYTAHEVSLRWMALFLSPLLGALAGWAGIMLIKLAADQGVLVIGTAFQDRTEELHLGLAIVLGLSERLFTDMASRVEGKVAPNGDVAAPG